MTFLASLVLLAAPAFADAGAVLGQPAPDFKLPDLAGVEPTLSQHKGKVVVLEWFNPGCPYVGYAHGEGPLKSLASEWGDKDVVWLAINSGAPGKQGHGIDLNKKATEDWKMQHPVLIDESGDVGRLYGAKTTPQMFVVDAEGKLVYGGGLDNAPMGRVEGNKQDYLVDALVDIAEKRAIQPDQTKPYGCSVKY